MDLNLSKSFATPVLKYSFVSISNNFLGNISKMGHLEIKHENIEFKPAILKSNYIKELKEKLQLRLKCSTKLPNINNDIITLINTLDQ